MGVQAPGEIRGLRAKATALSGAGATIPADRVAVRYATSWEANKKLPGGLDILLENPPAKVAKRGKHPRALAGVWVTVSVPAEEGAEQEEEAPAEQEPRVIWYILMVEKRSPGGEMTLERNRDVIETWMLSEPQHQYELSQFIGNLKAKADVQILAPRYRVLDEAYREAREARQRRLAQPTQLPPGVPSLPEGIQLPAGEAPDAHTHEGE